jgi:hypothetical protein
VDVLANNEKNMEIQKPSERECTIRTKSNSVLLDPVEIAKLKYGEQALAFDWGNNLQNESETISEVLDAVLKIRCGDGEIQFVMLRDLGVQDEREPLLLRGYSGKGPKPRSWSTSWADKDCLQATKRKFLIRRWSVKCTPRNGKRFDLCESKGSMRPAAEDERSFFRDEASLKIRIDERDQADILLRVETKARFKDELNQLEKAVSDFEDQHFFLNRQYKRDLAGRALDLRQVLANRLKDWQDRAPSDEGRAKIRQYKKDLDDLETIEKDAIVYSFVGELERVQSDATLELSVVVCLQLGSGTVVDVARFGDFATPDKQPGAE